MPMRAGRKSLILLVDDDEDLRAELALQLSAQADLEVIEAGLAAIGVSRAVEERPVVILLDINLPDADGRDVCKTMRAKGVNAPIILLTSLTDEGDTVAGLESGANDYVTKPFNLNVLIARIRAQIRSHQASEDAVFQLGPYEFRPGAKLLNDPTTGKRLRLTEKETNILKYLMRSGEKSVGREELLREVWGYRANVTTHTLETHIYRLRQKIEPDAQNPRLLITETGGYRLQP
jgi:DNA-binding response OmpR family regulator